MALDQLKAQIALLLDSLEDHPQDSHELHELIRQRLNQIKALNLPLPADLVELEARFDKDFAAKGRLV